MVKKQIFVHDMVHNNPGMVAYDTDFIDPSF